MSRRIMAMRGEKDQGGRTEETNERTLVIRHASRSEVPHTVDGKEETQLAHTFLPPPTIPHPLHRGSLGPAPRLPDPLHPP